jgi:hypothetical protein
MSTLWRVIPNWNIVLLSNDSLTGKFSPSFDLKNMISTYTKHFSRKKKPKFARFRRKKKKKNPNRQFFNDKFQQVTKNIERRILLFLIPTLISSLQPNLAKIFSRWWPLWLHHKIPASWPSCLAWIHTDMKRLVHQTHYPRTRDCVWCRTQHKKSSWFLVFFLPRSFFAAGFVGGLKH